MSKRAAKRAKKIKAENGPSATAEASSSPRVPAATAAAAPISYGPSTTVVAPPTNEVPSTTVEAPPTVPDYMVDCSLSSGPSATAYASAAQTVIPEGTKPDDTFKGVRGYYYSMSGHAEKCVERYLDLAKMKIEDLKVVSTPCIDDHVISAEKFATKGILAPVCTRIVLKVLYFARIARPDLLASVNVLARDVTRWTIACDDRLLRLISYIHCTKHWCMKCLVGDEPEDL